MTRLIFVTVGAAMALAAAVPPAQAQAAERASEQDRQEQPSPTRVGQRDPLDATGLRPYQVGATPASGITAFNPAMTVILDGVYFNQSRGLEEPAGFEGAEGHGHGDGHGVDEGFSLRETEVTFSATVDRYFDALAFLTVAGDEGIEIEEAYLVTRTLPAGLQIKAGKFLSDIGYINKQHPHEWLFVDRPLVNELLFGDEGLQEKGVQFSWVAPTPFYSRFGLEVLQGESEGIANFVGEEDHTIVTFTGDPDSEGPTRVRWQASNDLRERSGPRLFTGFAKLSPDLGHDNAMQFGVSLGRARAWQNQEAHSSGRLETWDGDARFWGVDAVYKYFANRQHGHGNWTVQGEYFSRRISVDYASREFTDGSTLAPTVTGGTPDAFSGTSRQDGAYLQAVYGLAPRWNAGLRAEAVGLTNRSLEADREDNTFEAFDTSYRYTAQLAFLPTEFSRLRLQLSYSDFADEDDDHGDGAWGVYLQYQMSLGVHGAHAF